jgi:serine/threonine protein kinase
MASAPNGNNEILSQAALDQLDDYLSESRLPELESEIAVVDWHHIEIDSTLGCGSFCRVYQVEVGSTNILKGKYALKCLNRKILLGEERSVREAGCIDLAVEAHLLSRLSHENIIKLQGRSPNSAANSNCQDWAEKGFFLLLDILDDTLKFRLNLLRLKKGSRLHGPLSKSAMMQRTKDIAVGVAKGLQHLHENNIVLRDLKPANVGFDKDGVPKIFDLGLAREIHTLKPKEVAGSLRYMSTEVALGLGATTKSDVYSFGILLWEIITLGKPFDQIGHTKKEFYAKVVKGSWRPSVSKMVPPSLAHLIKECWATDPDKRPDIKQVLTALKLEELASCRTPETRRPSSLRNLLKKTGSNSSAGSSSSSISNPLLSVKKMCKNIGDSLHISGTSHKPPTTPDDSRHIPIQWSSRTIVRW